MSRVSIIGSAGIPANYGGFETLVENLARFHSEQRADVDLTVYCSKQAFDSHPDQFEQTKLIYIPVGANGLQSVPYDIWSMLSAMVRRQTHMVVLGVSGCLFLPFVRIFSRTRIVTNIDGIEWRREKWKGPAKAFLRMSEWFAVRFSHKVIADNKAISDYVFETYGCDCDVIAYGGDHALDALPDPSGLPALPDSYALGLCRIEPENNIAMILDGWTALNTPLVFVGNWNKSDYGQALKAKYHDHPQITLLDPIYDAGPLRALRDRASLYVHGHSAGGTNPALVEMMHFGIPVLAHDNGFNRETTEGQARYFSDPADLVAKHAGLTEKDRTELGNSMRCIAQKRYTWDEVGTQYFAALSRR